MVLGPILSLMQDTEPLIYMDSCPNEQVTLKMVVMTSHVFNSPCRPNEAQQGPSHQKEEEGTESRKCSVSSDSWTVF